MGCLATVHRSQTKMEDFEEGEEKVGSFSIFFAEGEALAKQGQYRKAIESFTKVAGARQLQNGSPITSPAGPGVPG